MTRLSALLALALSLVLALTSQTTAQMRGQSVAAGEMVLCIGGSAVIVQVDSDGTPVGPAHLCPDCMAAQLTAPVPDPALPLRPAARHLTLDAPLGAPAVPARAPWHHAPARAPPVPV